MLEATDRYTATRLSAEPGLDNRKVRNIVLAKELVAPRYSFTSSGKLKVESKDEMKRRGVASPDVADAFCLTFAGTAGLVTRGAMSRRWQQPIDYPSGAWII